MPKVPYQPSGNWGTGTTAMYYDDTPLIDAEERISELLPTDAVNALYIDIEVDQPCTVQVLRFPDGVVAGQPSLAVDVVAGSAQQLHCSNIAAAACKIKITNTGGADMTAMHMTVRGGR